MNRYRNLCLVARRDFVDRTKNKAFKFSTVLMAVAVAASVALPALLANDDKPVRTVVIAGAAPAGLTDAISQLGPSTGMDVRTSAVAGIAEGEALLRNDQASLVAAPGRELVAKQALSDAGAEVDAISRLAASVNELTQLYTGLERAGLDASQTAAVLGGDSLAVRSLEADTGPSGGDTGRSTGVIIAVFLFLLLYTAWVVNSVVEEKTSRVVEVLLSTIKAREFLAGKVLGTALVAGLQGAVLVATVLLTQMAVEDRATTAIGLDVTSVLYGLLWLGAGYTLYAWMYAAAGSLANRSQDAQTLTFPIQIPLLLGYFVSLGAAVDGASKLLTIMSFVPFTAPMAMLSRMTLGDAAAWEVGLALVLTLATAALVMRFTIIIYTGAILRTGRRIKVREAWAAARR